MVFGDHGAFEADPVVFNVIFASSVHENATSGADIIKAGAGEDYVFGGGDSDVIFGGEGVDVLLGDHGVINASLPSGHRHACAYTAGGFGANDTIFGEGGDDMIVGGQGDDFLSGGPGEDDLTGGHNVEHGADGSDVIEGGDGDDVVLGDNGFIERQELVYNTDPPPPPPPHVVTVPYGCVDVAPVGNASGTVAFDIPNDPVHGTTWGGVPYGSDQQRCWHTDCETASVRLDWTRLDLQEGHELVSVFEAAADGTTSFVWRKSSRDLPESSVFTQNVVVMLESRRYTLPWRRSRGRGKAPENGIAFGWECAAVTPVPPTPVPMPPPPTSTAGPPYVHALQWLRQPAVDGRFGNIIRFVQRFDDVDGVAGSDVLKGGNGDDVLHGQRGDDTIDGGAGDDELYGELGDDVLSGGEGHDVLLGDVGHVIRAFDGDVPRLDAATGAWHRNVVLETPAVMEWAAPAWRTASPAPRDAAALLETDLLMSFGVYEDDMVTKRAAGTAPWETLVAGLTLEREGADQMDGGAGNDVLFGQGGDDHLAGGEGDDVLYGDEVQSAYHYRSTLPLVARAVRVLAVRDPAVAVRIDPFGNVLHVPFIAAPEQAARTAGLRVLDGAAVATLLADDYLEMLAGVGADDLRRTDDAAGVLRPYAALLPDAARHAAHLPGNDELHGGAGNDVLVGDRACHHAVMSLAIPELDATRDAASARWQELQVRLAQLSADAGTLAAQDGTHRLPAEVRRGNDQLFGGDGNDLLVGDGLDAVVDLVYTEGVAAADQGTVVESLLRAYNDYEWIAADLAQYLYVHHHAVVATLHGTRGAGVTTPALHLYLSGDTLEGGEGDDTAVGDTLLSVVKGVRKADQQEGPPPAGRAGHFVPYAEVLNSLRHNLTKHVRDDFAPPASLGGNGSDALAGDFALVADTTFEAEDGGISHADAKVMLSAHLGRVQGLVQRMVLQPAYPSALDTYDDRSFGAPALSLYLRKTHWGYFEPQSGSFSDDVDGGGGEDVVTGGNSAASVVRWAADGTVRVVALPVPSAFHRAMHAPHFKRLSVYKVRDRSADRDFVTGGEGHVDAAGSAARIYVAGVAPHTPYGQLSTDSIVLAGTPLWPSCRHARVWFGLGLVGVVRAELIGPLFPYYYHPFAFHTQGHWRPHLRWRFAHGLAPWYWRHGLSGSYVLSRRRTRRTGMAITAGTGAAAWCAGTAEPSMGRGWCSVSLSLGSKLA